jgi:DNA-binding response OmpR family regulator
MAPARILISDDDSLTGAFYLRLLTNAGYKASRVPDGSHDATFVACYEEQPDLLITDLLKQGRNGLALCRRLKEHERTALIAIIVVSGLGAQSLDDAHAALYLGVDLCLPKPISVDRLLSAVRDVSDTHALQLRLNPLTGLPPWPVLEQALRWFALERSWSLLRLRLGSLATNVLEIGNTYTLARAIGTIIEEAQLELRVWVAHGSDERELLVLSAPEISDYVFTQLRTQFGSRLQCERINGERGRIEGLGIRD